MRQLEAGFTLVEIMIVVAIIGLMAMIAVPSGMKARARACREACISNLRQIDASKDQYLLEHNVTNGTCLSLSDLSFYTKNISDTFCPLASRPNRSFSNSYSVNPVGFEPECLISPGSVGDPDHSLVHR